MDTLTGFGLMWFQGIKPWRVALSRTGPSVLVFMTVLTSLTYLFILAVHTSSPPGPSLSPPEDAPLRPLAYHTSRNEEVGGQSFRYTVHRSKDNGEVVTVVDQGSYFYIYSAFFDNRQAVPLLVVRVMAAVESNISLSHIVCHVTYADRGEVRHQMAGFSTSAEMHGPRQSLVYGRKSKPFQKYVITCPALQPIRTAPDLFGTVRISLSKTFRNITLDETNSVPLEYPERPNKSQVFRPLGTCTALLYGYLEPTRLIEWIELQMILGVSHVVAYNGSVADASGVVLRHYEQKGFLEIRQIWPIRTPTVPGDIQLRQVMAINDCLYRNMYRYERLLVVDTDEIVIPRSRDTLTDTIRELVDVKQEQRQRRRPADFVFASAVFFSSTSLFPNPDIAKPKEAHMLRYRKRSEVTTFHRKSIVDPEGCLMMWMHFCTSSLPGYSLSLDKPVSPEVAFVHHYRQNCLEARCQWRSKPDNTMLKYETPLIYAINITLQALGLQTIHPSPQQQHNARSHGAGVHVKIPYRSKKRKSPLLPNWFNTMGNGDAQKMIHKRRTELRSNASMNGRHPTAIFRHRKPHRLKSTSSNTHHDIVNKNGTFSF